MSTSRIFPERIEGRHVLIALFAFFGVMLLVNGIFLYYAVGTFNGFETSDAYRKGVRYNERIASDSEQAERGWQPSLRYDQQLRRLVMEVVDRHGRPVAGLEIAGEIRRPVNDGADQSVKLVEISPALYVAALDLEPGQWTFAAELYEQGSAAEPVHRHKQRVWVEEEK